MRIRRVVIGLAVVACAVALATSASLNRTTTPAVRQPGKIARGFLVFNDYFCAACHVMKAAGPPSYRGPNVCDGDTACTVGVDFNKVHVSSQAAIPVVEHGLPAALPVYVTQMPPFARVLTKRQIQDVAAFLAKYSGGYKTCVECARFKPSGFPTG
jgi:mono/diheme cytochrome c family protein